MTYFDYFQPSDRDVEDFLLLHNSNDPSTLRHPVPHIVACSLIPLAETYIFKFAWEVESDRHDVPLRGRRWPANQAKFDKKRQASDPQTTIYNQPPRGKWMM